MEPMISRANKYEERPRSGKGAPCARRFVTPRGFTLTELVIVLAILGIAAAVAAPSISATIQNYRAGAVARQIAADLQFARMNAVSKKMDCRVTLDVANNQYTIEIDNGGWTQVGSTRSIGEGVTLGAISAPADLMVTFTPLGMARLSATAADGTASATASAAGKVVTVTISPTGGIQIAG